MCEFCSNGPNSNLHGADERDSRFTGFFSPEAIEAALRQAAAANVDNDDGVSRQDDEEINGVGGEEDDDGT